jgi:hypothetical protein
MEDIKNSRNKQGISKENKLYEEKRD